MERGTYNKTVIIVESSLKLKEKSKSQKKRKIKHKFNHLII